jgi:tRNA(fMet)-specific endonuclease VapC
MGSWEDMDEPFPDLDEGLLPLDDIELRPPPQRRYGYWTPLSSPTWCAPRSLVAKRIQELSLTTPQSLCTSVVVACELQFSIARKGAVTLAAMVDTVLRFVAVLSVDREVIPHYAAIRTYLECAGTPIGPNDILIAAHARALGATLVSGDADFARVPGLQV